MQDQTNSHSGRVHQRGYSLVEVMIAMALMGVVITAIMALFFIGRNNVYSGKQMTNAVSVGTRVLEDLSPLDKKSIYSGLFGVADTSTGYATAVSLGNPPVSYSNCLIRSTDATIGQPTATDVSTQSGPNILDKWKSQLGNNLSNGSVTLIMIPKLDTASPANNPVQFGTCAVMQIRILIQWVEMKRQRQLILDTTRAY